ncbi:MAG: HAMP domain-containing protein [Caldilineaceae bacterium]|nr:HAMP domain-containing protein [Caldilineaceae bacterium]
MNKQALPVPSRIPWRQRLQFRLIASYGLLVLIVLSLLMALVINAVYSVQIDQAEHDLEVKALLAANALEDPLSGYSSELEEYERRESHDGKESDDGEDSAGEEDDAGDQGLTANAPGTNGLQHLANRYAQQDGLWVTILDVRGDAIVDSRGSAAAIGNQLLTPEFQAATQLVEQHDIRTDPAGDVRYMFAAAPVQIGDNLLGVVRMAQPMSDVLAPIRGLALTLLLAGAAALALATVLGIFLARRLVRPIQRLQETALAVASGDLSQSADIDSIDEIGSLARTFDYMVSELQEMIRRQRLFIANASHELRTPLTNIKLRSEALLTLDGEDPALSKRYLHEIDSEADRLGRLAATLLDLSKIENREPPPPEAPTDIRPMLLDVARAMRMRMKDAGLTFAVSVEELLPPLSVRANEVETVVLNLLDNAVKYTPPGGSVTLRVETEQTAGRTGVAKIVVSDSGPGIPPEDLAHIFEYFYRVDPARSRLQRGEGTGAGLGLAIVKTLVEQNGGRISVSSTEKQGTAFTIAFPIPSR